MPLLYQQDINEGAKIGVWRITEDESFFHENVAPLYTISHPKKRIQHLAARLLLLTLEPGFPLHEVRITESGKPYLETGHHFSISHSDNHAAAIISPKQSSGIDIEMISEKILSLRHKFAGSTETQLMLQVSADTATALTLIWSAKEALYKWYGAGGLDFKKHMKILSISENDGRYLLDCELHMEQLIRLQVVAVLMEGYCLAYVLA